MLSVRVVTQISRSFCRPFERNIERSDLPALAPALM
jgi:hypothetical protein